MNSINLQLCFDESHIKLPESSYVTHCDLETKSILKPPKVRAPLQEVDFGFNQSIDPGIIRKRRVSFAGVNIIKEFHSKAESVIICSTPAYEETFSTSSDSSALTSSVGASSCGDDCTLLNDTMDLTDAAIDQDICTQTQHEKKDCQGSSSGGFASNSPTFLSSAPGTVKMQNVTMHRGGVDHLTNIPIQQSKHPNTDPARLLVNALLEVSNIPEDSSLNNSLISKNEAEDHSSKIKILNHVEVAEHCEISSTIGSKMEFGDPLSQNSASPVNKSDHFSNHMSISGMELTEAIPSIFVQAKPNFNQFISQCHRKNSSININKTEMELTEVIPQGLDQGENMNCLPETEEKNFETNVMYQGLNFVNNHKIHPDSPQTTNFTEGLQPQKVVSDKGVNSPHKENIPPLQGNYLSNSPKMNDFVSLQMELTHAHGFPLDDQNQKNTIATCFKPDTREKNDFNCQQDMETSLMECTEAVPNQYSKEPYLDTQRDKSENNVSNTLVNESFDMEITEAIPKRQTNPGENLSKNAPFTLTTGKQGTFFCDLSQDNSHSQSKMEFTEALPSLFGKGKCFQEKDMVRPDSSYSLFVYPNNTKTTKVLSDYSQETRWQEQRQQEVLNNETLMDFTEAVPQMRHYTDNLPPFICQKSAKGHNATNETLMELTEAIPTRAFTKNTNVDINHGNDISPTPTSSVSVPPLGSNSFGNMSLTKIKKCNASPALTSSKIEYSEIRPCKEVVDKSDKIVQITEDHTLPVKNESNRALDIITKSPPGIQVFSQANNSQIDFTDMLPVVKERNVSHLRKQLTFSMTMKKDVDENTQMDFTETVLSRKHVQSHEFPGKNAEIEINVTEEGNNGHQSVFKNSQSSLNVIADECQNLNDNSFQQIYKSSLVSPIKRNSLNVTNTVEVEQKLVTDKFSPHNSSEGYGSIQDAEITSNSNNISVVKYIGSEFISSEEPTALQKVGDCKEDALCEEFNMSVDVSFNYLEDVTEKTEPLSDFERMGNQQGGINCFKENSFLSEQIIVNGGQSSEGNLPSALRNHAIDKSTAGPYKSDTVNLMECSSTQALFMSNCISENQDFNKKREASKMVLSDEDKWQLIKTNRSFMNTISFSFVSYIFWKRTLPWPVDIIIKLPFIDLTVNTEILEVRLKSKIGKKDKMGSLANYCMTKNMNIILSEDWLNSECKTIKDLLVAIRLVEDEYNFLQPLISNLQFMYIKTYWFFQDSQLVIPFISSRRKYYFEIRINVSSYKKISEKDVYVINHIGKLSRDEVQTLFKKFLPFNRSEDILWLFTQALKELVATK